MHHLVYHLFNIKVGNFNLMPIITIFFNYCHADLYLMICFQITLYFIPDSSHKFLFSYEYYDCFLKNHNLNHTKEDFIYLTLSLKNF